MKAFVSTLIAACLLYLVDKEFNDSRYTSVITQAITRAF